MPPISNMSNVAGQNQPVILPVPPPVKKHRVLKIILWIFLSLILILGILIFIGYNADKNKKIDEFGYQIKTTSDLKSINAIPAFMGESVPKVIVISDKNLIDSNGCFIVSEASGSQFIKNITINNKKYCVSGIDSVGRLGLAFRRLDYTTEVGGKWYVIGFSINHVFEADCDIQNPKEKDLCFNEESAESFFENIVSTFSVSNSNTAIANAPTATTSASEFIATTSQATKDFKIYKNTVDNFEISFPPELDVYVYQKQTGTFVKATTSSDIRKEYSMWNGFYITQPNIVESFNKKQSPNDVSGIKLLPTMYLVLQVTPNAADSFDQYINNQKRIKDQQIQIYGPSSAGTIKEMIINEEKAILFEGVGNNFVISLFNTSGKKMYNFSYGPASISSDNAALLKTVMSTFKFTSK